MGEQSTEQLRGSSWSENGEGRMKLLGSSSVDALSELVWSPRNGQQSMSSQQEEEEEETLVDEGNQACTEMNIPLSGVGDGSGEDVKPEREEMDEDNKVETNDDDSETRAPSSKRSLGIGGEPEDLLANEQLRPQEEEEETSLDVAERLEATDENDLAGKALVVACESSRGDEEGGPSSGSHERLAKAKGKEKAFSDGNFDEDEESFGSVESCNSAGLLSRGKKRPPGFEQQLILGSKRLKTLSQECLGSTSKLKQDSSFMNWISNMTKGIWKGSEEEEGDNKSPFLPLTTTTSDANAQQETISPKENTGFQSFFQSIYCPKKSVQDAAVEMDPSNDANVASLQEVSLNISPSESKPSEEEQKTCVEAVEKVSAPSLTNKSSSLQSKPKPSEEQKSCEEAYEKVIANRRNSGPESLWISRFSSKRYGRELAKDANILPIVSSLRIESSEAMASLFARRLEAMKHIMMPSGDEGQTTVTICFYCGKKGHSLQDCLQVTDTELRDLVQNISARDGKKEEASSLCIRCFQLSHWAVTCPNKAPPLCSPGAEDRAMKHALASTSGGTKLPFTDVPKTVFDAVQILRLTRTDVLKWINTKKSVWGLEGFFLRLRLGKWEEGLGGTGYHVARIEGATEGQSSRKQSVSSSIPVKVGGMSCYVESQFISNKDFLEEELKAWWRSTGKSAERSGGGDSFPSAEELSRKIQQRKMLGV